MDNKDLKILYIANVQGEQLVSARKIFANYSIAGNTKVFGICRSIAKTVKKISIYSPGSVAERSGKFYNKFKETVISANDGKIDVFYGETIDNRWLRCFVESFAMFRYLPKLIKTHKFDILVIYNISLLTLIASFIGKIYKIKIILEYEDSAIASREKKIPFYKRIYRIHELFMQKICFGVFSPSIELLKAIGIHNSMLLPGVLSEDLYEYSCKNINRVVNKKKSLKCVYAGGFDISKGIDRFLQAVQKIDRSLEIHICGKGRLKEEIKELSKSSKHEIVFHGLVRREELIQLLNECDIGLNPHRSDLHEGGSWPFKVVEYLAGCGTVFCNRTGNIPLDFAKYLFVYEGNSVEEIATAFRLLIDQEDQLLYTATGRKKWALENFGPDAVCNSMMILFSGGTRAHD
jgi:glycosyltransferase involved in cell wall biosynthesis